jgi:hypothetical protein
MSEETENTSPEEQPITPNESAETPKEQPVAPKVFKKPAPKKSPFAAFINKNNKFNSPKGSSSRKGNAFKGGGVKKGK